MVIRQNIGQVIKVIVVVSILFSSAFYIFGIPIGEQLCTSGRSESMILDNSHNYNSPNIITQDFQSLDNVSDESIWNFTETTARNEMIVPDQLTRLDLSNHMDATPWLGLGDYQISENLTNVEYTFSVDSSDGIIESGFTNALNFTSNLNQTLVQLQCKVNHTQNYNITFTLHKENNMGGISSQSVQQNLTEGIWNNIELNTSSLNELQCMSFNLTSIVISEVKLTIRALRVVDYTDNPNGQFYTMNDISNWHNYSLTSNDTVDSDGDCLTLSGHGDYENDFNAIYSNISNRQIYQFVEIRYRCVNSLGILNISIGVYSDYNLTGDIQWFQIPVSEQWTSYRFPVMVEIGSILFGTSMSIGYTSILEVDFLIACNDDVLGWQHSGESTRGVNLYDPWDANDQITSDGTYLQIKMNRDSGIDYDRFSLNSLSNSHLYYPIFEMGYFFNTTTFYDAHIRFWSGDSIGSGENLNCIINKYTNLSILRVNPGFDVGCIEIWVSLTQTNVQLSIDYLRFYGLSNFTVDYSINSSSTDVFHVFDGELNIDSQENTSLTLSYDIELFVETDRYNTILFSSENILFNVSVNISDWLEFPGSSRVCLTEDGVLSRISIEIFNSSNGSLKAIIFHGDFQAPEIVQLLASHLNPSPFDDISIYIVVGDDNDTTEVKVETIFSSHELAQSTWYARNQGDGIWIINIGHLESGFYYFETTANDTFNTQIQYIAITVSASSENFEISDVDFDSSILETEVHLKLSFYSTMNCSWYIFDDNDVVTESGYAEAGYSLIEWTRELTNRWERFSVLWSDGHSWITYNNTFYTGSLDSSGISDSVNVLVWFALGINLQFLVIGLIFFRIFSKRITLEPTTTPDT